MPYVFITSTYPYDKGVEAAKIYIKSISEFKSAIKGLSKEIVPNAIKARKEGIEATGIHDIKPGKLEEFLLLQQKYMVPYHDVEGFRYTIEVRFKVEEALEMIGMNMPE